MRNTGPPHPRRRARPPVARPRCAVIRALATALPLVAAAGCGAPQIDNTRLTSGDLVRMTDQMAESIAASPDVAASAAGGRMTVAMLPASNQTNDIIPRTEAAAFVARLRALLAQSQRLAPRFAFVLSPEASEALARSEAAPLDLRTTPTHSLSATFHALTTADRSHRSDTYLCAFQLTDLRTDRIIWEDAYEIKRAVARNRLD